MKILGFGTLCLGLFALAAWLSDAAPAGAQQGKQEGPAIIHNVYFKLKDRTPAHVQKLIASCQKYLSKQPGVTYFACGGVSELDRPVNDRDWDVGLHVVFVNRAAHDTYQTDAQHLQFINENKENWEKVRVFDTNGQ